MSRSGKRLATPIHSISVHGDSPHAVDTARTMREALQDAGYRLRPLPQLAAPRQAGESG